MSTVAARTPKQRARTRPLSEHEVVATALAIIAEVGVSGLTMRQLSDRLGVALGATYKHVPNKSALLARVANELFTQIEHDVPEDEEWSGRVRALFVRIHDTFRDYPGLADQITYQPATTDPPQLGTSLIKLLSDAGFSTDEVDALMNALFFYTTGALLTAARPSSPGSSSAFRAGLDLLLGGARAQLASPAGQRG
ncbi:MAG TPA: TetR family transcriptional regulator [Acidimicrobiia bacterium]|nr:TetR family transcriptional regulator [Acidimicrobiia bacterium]